jgi:tetratricopeptide (TPR) repeat protein
MLKRYEDAIPGFEMAVNLNPDLQNLSSLGVCYGMMGGKLKALEIIEKMKKIEGAEIVGNGMIGKVYGAIEEWDTAFQYFDKAIVNHESYILWLKYFLRDAYFDMKDPRALRLLEKMGQPYL